MKQLEYCKICKNREVSRQEGIVCSLTDEKPTFENNCDDFQEDELQLKRLKRFKKSHNQKEIYFESAKKMLLTGLPLTAIGALIYMMPALNFGMSFLILLGAIAFLAGIIFTMFGIIQLIGINKTDKVPSNRSGVHQIEEDEIDEIY